MVSVLFLIRAPRYLFQVVAATELSLTGNQDRSHMQGQQLQWEVRYAATRGSCADSIEGFRVGLICILKFAIGGVAVLTYFTPPLATSQVDEDAPQDTIVDAADSFPRSYGAVGSSLTVTIAPMEIKTFRVEYTTN